jgi:hypothetical protein
VRQAGGPAAGGFDLHRVEIEGPALEYRPRHRLQRLAHPPIEINCVVQRAEDLDNGELLQGRAAREHPFQQALFRIALGTWNRWRAVEARQRVL